MKRLLILIGLVLCASRVEAAACSNTAVGSFTCIQSTAGGANASSAPTLAMPSNLTSGSIIVGVVGWTSNSVTLNSITASSGCTGLSVTLVDNPTSAVFRVAGFYITSYSSGACTLQFNFSASTGSNFAVEEISGQDTSAPVGTRHAACIFDNVTNGHVYAPGGASCASGSTVTPSGTDYVFGGYVGLSQGFIPTVGTSPFTLRDAGNGSGPGSWGSEDKTTSSATAADFNWTGANEYGGVVLIDVAPASGATNTCTLTLLGVGKCH